MAESPLLTSNCPRCGYTDVTMEVIGVTAAGRGPNNRSAFEVFGKCRKCGKSAVIVAEVSGPNVTAIETFGGRFINGWYALAPLAPVIPMSKKCPEYTPDNVRRIFDESATCLAIGCFDAAGTMARKTLDVATRSLLPSQLDDPKHHDFIAWKTRKDLRLRLDILFERKLLPENLKELASCIHEDGNDAAHAPTGLGEAEAKDLQDFTSDVLETIYTLPGRIAESKRRREERRGTPS